MRLLLAPDKFRGTLTARQAAEAFETGWRRARPGDTHDLAPLADGGEGTLEALVDALGGTVVGAQVTGPLGERVDAGFGVAEGPNGRVAIVEMARASGLALISESRRDPGRTTTYGTGELIRLALDHEPAHLVVCIGGSATNDGGAGMAQALGARLSDERGDPLEPGGRALVGLKGIDVSSMDPRLRRLKTTVASDVDSPLCGPSGASAVFGPQKGASPEDVQDLDRSLAHLAAVVHRDLGINLKDEPGAGAAGGLGFGLMAFCGAHLRPGIDVVMEAVGLAERMALADVAVTGEGKLDQQSLHGKVPAGVLRLAGETDVPVLIVCGVAEVEPAGAQVWALSERFGLEAALQDARGCLIGLAAELAQRWQEPDGS
ncbi:MAG: glycerate 2-kinase [Actinomycetota bacterium]|jgi:glycerate kinase|nr:glycerate 2-kinase [Actinomycetota bacterium]